MSTIITRAGKGSPLTNNEVDANFNNLNSTKVETSAVGTLSTQNANSVAITGGAVSGTSITVTDNVFTLQDNVDPTKQAQFQLSPLATGTTVTYTMPLGIGGAATLADLQTSQTFSGAKTFSSTTLNFGSSVAPSTTQIAYGATSSGNSKTVNIGTGGLSGSTTNITIGAVAGTSTTTMNGQVDIGGTTTSVNFARITGAATGAAPTLSAQGSDANITLKLQPKGTGITQFTSPLWIQRGYGGSSLIALGGSTAYSVGTNASGIDNDTVIDATKTSSYTAYSTYPSTTAAAFNLQSLRHYSAQFFQLGAGSAVTNQYGFFTDNSLIGATNNYGFFSGITAATGRFNFYASGTAANVFVGQTSLGGTVGAEALRAVNTASAVNYVQTVGSVTNGGVLTAAAPELSAQGSDPNINLKLTPKGTGTVQYGTYTATVLSPTGFITITDAGGTSRRLLVG